MIFYFGWINEVPAHDIKTTTIEWVVPGSAAAQAGLEPGDIDPPLRHRRQSTWDTGRARMTLDPNQTVPVTVERAGKTLQPSMRVPGEIEWRRLAGMLPQFMPGPIGDPE